MPNAYYSTSFVQYPLLMNLLQIDDVVKQFQDFTAVNHVSFDVPRGCTFGMLGPNGAGKTSLIRIITSITRADGGRVFFDGQPLRPEHSEKIGYMPEERGLYKKDKVGEGLVYLAQLRGMSRADAVREVRWWLDRLGLLDWAEKKAEDLSKGMQQKLQFIATVVHKPQLLILDEPFTGLDPINANLLKDEIMRLRDEGATVIFSTHRMEQVEELCDHIVLINRGQNILQGEVKEVRNRYKENLFRLDYSGELPEHFAENMDIRHQQAGSIVVKIADANPNILLRSALDTGITIRSLNEILPSINDIFIQRVGQSNDASEPKTVTP